MKNSIILLLLIFASINGVMAQRENTPTIISSYLHGLEYEVNAGFNIGGFTPIPIPSELRKINKYRPNIGLCLGTEITKYLTKRRRTAIILGLHFENRTMTTDATTKSYKMEIIGDNQERIKGYWTGDVYTEISNSYITLPVLFGFKCHPRLVLKMGANLLFTLSKKFSGHVGNGYIRENTPIGQKVIFTDGKTAPYDFSNEQRDFNLEGFIGLGWEAFKHLQFNTGFNIGIRDIFRKSFETISFNMYPIFFRIGFGYKF